MKITLDVRSLVVGFMAAAIIILGFSFKNTEAEKPGKFTTEIGANGLVILNTETGGFIVAKGLEGYGELNWFSGNSTGGKPVNLKK